jgi:hypothetical protein
MPDRSTRFFGALRAFVCVLQVLVSLAAGSIDEYPRNNSLTSVLLVNYASRRNCECSISRQAAKALRSKPVFTKEVTA